MRWTTLTSLMLFVPLLMLLVVLKVEVTYKEPEEDSNGVGIYLANKKTIDEIAHFIDPSSCKCNCDNSNERSADSTTIVTTMAAEEAAEVAGLTETVTLNQSAGQGQQLAQSSPPPPPPPPPVTIFVITPTYTRPTQMADMTRLAQTLMLVKNIFWIVAEDSHTYNQQVSELLNRTNIPHVHLLGPRPKTHLDKRSGRGVSNRLAALNWLRSTYTNTSQQGVIYFADDDNAYDIRIFEEMRDTKKVSLWPVGLIAKIGLSTPIIDINTGKIIGFHDPYIVRRKFVVDMAGFAVNLGLFLSKPKATMPYKVGYEEDYFIQSLGVKMDDLELKADNCTKIYVWHTKTQPGTLPSFTNLKKEKMYNSTNLVQLYNNVLGSSQL